MSLKPSRFSCLKDEYEEKSEKQDQTLQTTSKPKKKKNKKKSPNVSVPVSSGVTDEWVARDNVILDQNYERDMEEALLQSQLDLEKKNAEKAALAESLPDTTVPHSNDEEATKAMKNKNRNKNRTHSKPQSISLEEFQHVDAPDTTDQKNGDSHKRQKGHPIGSGDTLFEDVHAKAKRIVKLEKDREEYDRQFKVDAVIRSRYTEKLEEKEKIIVAKEEETEAMQQMIEALRIELQEKEKTTKKLEHLLNQGKLREVCDLLKQIDDLCVCRDDLTNQLTETTTELEKERSKNHGMKAELDRLKAQKHAVASSK